MEEEREARLDREGKRYLETQKDAEKEETEKKREKRGRERHRDR